MNYQVWKTYTVTERVVIGADSAEHAIKVAEYLASSLFKTEDISDPIYRVVDNEELSNEN